MKMKLYFFVLALVLVSPTLYFIKRQPVAVYPEEISFGEKELGDVAVATINFSNAGNQILKIFDVQTSCSCTGFEKKEGEEVFKIKELEIGPKSTVELMVRLSVRGLVPGSSGKNEILFKTNDPYKQNCKITLRIEKVNAGVYSVPDSLILSHLKPNRANIYSLDIFDDSIVPRSITRIESTNPKLLKLKLEIPKESNLGLLDKGKPNKVGRLEVTILSDGSTNFNEVIKITASERNDNPTLIRVIGNFYSNLQVSPETMFLPRKINEKLVFESNGFVKLRNNREINVSIGEIPRWLSVEFPKSQLGKRIPFKVSLNERAFKDREGKFLKIPFSCVVDGVMEESILTVYFE